MEYLTTPEVLFSENPEQYKILFTNYRNRLNGLIPGGKSDNTLKTDEI